MTGKELEVREEFDAVKLRVWDFTRPCSGAECDLRSVCGFNKENELMPCGVELEKMEGIYKAFLKLAEAVNDVFTVQWIENNILPLYTDLVQLTIDQAKFSNKNSSLVYKDSVGRYNVYPTLAEKNRVNNSIVKLWKELGLLETAKRAGLLGIEGSLKFAGRNVKKFTEGDGLPGYYEKMSGQLDDEDGDGKEG
jgi:hypothetical protein